MAGEKNDRQHRVDSMQFTLQIESSEPRKLNIQQQTARHVRSLCAEKCLGRRKGLDFETRGREQPPQGVTKRVVIIDYED